ncbi:hypothetical protein LCGC14_1200580 [marine sediment metagenome]|uniref:dihydropteroate synthase n=1 Tax=marine sediment metagenome TaxID=412755 RepID=A0A0F9LLG0_9ZZZZ
MLEINGREFDFNKRTYFMGVLNVTPDSFSDGGRYSVAEDALKQALLLEEQGADVIDIGGESTRPGSPSVSIEEELSRVIPALKLISKESKVPISIDSYKPAVIKEALNNGASIINDISGLTDPQIRQIAVKEQAPVIIMHMQGTPQNMQKEPHYDDVVEEVKDFLKTQAEKVIAEGLDKSKVIIDPGIGFGKTLEHNLQVLRNLSKFKTLGFPLLVGTSRKSFIGALSGAEVDDRLPGTIASNCAAVAAGAEILRVHEVGAIKQAVQVTEAVVKKDV